MWQQLIVAVIVIAAAVYAARVLGPRRWRRRANAPGECGCGKGEDGGCH
jgi:NADH:ubiquinone oxidoreductase subunit 3 (subunit A)